MSICMIGRGARRRVVVADVAPAAVDPRALIIILVRRRLVTAGPISCGAAGTAPLPSVAFGSSV